MSETSKFIIYVIFWGILGAVFTFLGKREKTIKKKKIIQLIGNLSIVALMFGFALWAGIPLIGTCVFILIALAFVLLANKYTFYCKSCGQGYQTLLSRDEYCGKCGTKHDG